MWEYVQCFLNKILKMTLNINNNENLLLEWFDRREPLNSLWTSPPSIPKIQKYIISMLPPEFPINHFLPRGTRRTGHKMASGTPTAWSLNRDFTCSKREPRREPSAEQIFPLKVQWDSIYSMPVAWFVIQMFAGHGPSPGDTEAALFRAIYWTTPPRNRITF